jgi:DUF4097 and DUF4098 domain-containing protein YvlB
MSAYPPPPPSGGYNPYDRAARDAAKAQYRAQQQAIRAQQKMQHAAWKAQRRAMRRSSIVGPLLLLTLGVFFLLVELNRVSPLYALNRFGHWWPVVLIGAGVILVIEWVIDRDRPQSAGGPRSIGGGVVALLIFIAFLGVAATTAVRALEWKQQRIGEGFGKLDEVLGNRSDHYDDLSQAIPAGGLLVVRNPHGDVVVTGTSTDGQVHVSLHEQAYSWNESDTQKKMQQLRPVFSQDDKTLTLAVASVAGGQADLTITVPAGSAVTVNADHGDVNVSQVQQQVTISANHGDVSVTDVAADVQATINDDDSTVTVRSIKGAVAIQGHTGDVNISEVSGPLALQGDFYGTTDLKNIGGKVSFHSSRTQFDAAKLGDEFSVESDTLTASSLVGPVVLRTSDKNITLDRLQGNVEVTNKNGDVHLTSVSPLGSISVQNTHGGVDVGLPQGASFTVNAQTRNGDMENDYGFSAQGDGDDHSLHGTQGGGAAKISLSTSDGDVTLRKVTAMPAPPAPPAPPEAPAAPKAPRITRTPASPKAPEAPKPPSSVTF